MKIRSGFVSNSSSSSFVLDLSYYKGDELKNKLQALTERSDNLSRCTGIITDIEGWLKLSLDGEEPCYEFEKILPILVASRGKDLVIVRESDEGMGGYLSESGITTDEFAPFLVYSFEYH